MNSRMNRCLIKNANERMIEQCNTCIMRCGNVPYRNDVCTYKRGYLQPKCTF